MQIMLRKRAQDILTATVDAFIESGTPVSSEELYEEYNFGVKPATIRAELVRLTNDGLLLQPHTSGGRIPTEKGYRLMVDQLLERMFAYTDGSSREEEQREGAVVEKLVLALKKQALQDFVHEFSHDFNCMSCVVLGNNVYKNGFDILCKRMQFTGGQEFVELAEDMEHFEETATKMYERDIGTNQPVVWFGKESPLKSRHIAILADMYEVGGEQMLVMALGPQRMDYEKPLRAFKGIRKKFKKKNNYGITTR